MRAFIFDIDGTLSVPECTADEYARMTPELRKELYGKALDCEPIPAVTLVAQGLIAQGFDLLFFTSRCETSRAATAKWLQKTLELPFSAVNLYMKRQGDKSSSPAFKEVLVLAALSRGYEIIGAFEDRRDVCEIYKRYNITTFNIM